MDTMSYVTFWWNLDAPPYFRQATIPQSETRHHHQNRQTLDVVIKVVRTAVEINAGTW